MDPPERWSAADKYGTTPYEQSHPRPLGDRLAEEQSDVQSGGTEQPERTPSDLDKEMLDEAAGRGQVADEAGGSMASTERTPEPPD
jgi:hypothetical protein